MPRGTQLIDGREYVYEYISVWNKEKQRSEQKREYLGRIINGEFVQNEKYALREELTREKELGKKRDAAPAAECTRLFVGATYLLDKIGDKLGVAADLKACFPSIHEEMLSLAYFLALEPSLPLYRFKRWALTHEHPHGKEISSQRSSELLSMITEGAKMEFFKRQAKRRMEQEYLFYDSTSISSYSEQLKQVKYGKNKDGDNLAQLNLGLLLGQVVAILIFSVFDLLKLFRIRAYRSAVIKKVLPLYPALRLPFEKLHLCALGYHRQKLAASLG
jgi:hypothetical protein